MSVDNAREHLKQWHRQEDVLEFDTSSATVGEAADALGVEPARIAKTLSFQGKEESALLVVTAGDAKIDNQKFRGTFDLKAKMLSPDEVLEHTGHAVGGVCPFGLTKKTPVYIDISLKRFETVFPACGSSNSAIELTKEELFTYSEALEWVDVCKNWAQE